MGRIARVVIPELPHHVTQRGNRRSAVFFDDAGRQGYLNLIRHYARIYDVKVWAYCLMTNHVHFVVVPRREDGLGLLFREAHSAYSAGLNRRNGMSGHLWQGRFFSTPLDEMHLWAAVRYVERNPVRAGMLDVAEKYPWSSAAARCGLRNDSLLSPDIPLDGVIADWSEWLRVEEAEQTALIRSRTQTGRPCGSDSFVESLEKALGRTLSPQTPGPKKKSVDESTGELF